MKNRGFSWNPLSETEGSA